MTKKYFEIKITLIYGFILLCCFVLCLLIGSVNLSWKNYFDLKFLQEHTQWQDILSIRFVRVCQSCFVGALMSLCGFVLQNILRNPLADPSILGVSSGGVLSSVLVSFVGFPSFLSTYQFFNPNSLVLLASFIGCFFTIGILFFIKNRLKNLNDEYLLPVIGIILNSFFAAILTLLISISDYTKFFELQYYLIGSLRYIPIEQLFLFILISLVPLNYIIKHSI
ncbi:MAG: iron ABC transporter permease, partial [Silvanigrellaceae bacterium]|nr:iron ABC transporter permease [Silvanigrellaceae bacterium]